MRSAHGLALFLAAALGVGTARPSSDAKYYLVDSGQTFDTGITGVRAALSTDGQRIIAAREGAGMTLLVFDLATGQIIDTGLLGCTGSQPCWVDISTGTIVSELWEGGSTDEYGNVVYPPADLNGDGVIDSTCVAMWAKI